MKKQTQIILSAMALLLLAIPAAAKQAPVTTGSISEVTVYRGQALVTRTIDIDMPTGTSELVVKNLPMHIIPESLYAQTTGNIKVISVRYRERAVQEDTREEVKKLDAQIKIINNQIRYAERGHKHGGNVWRSYSGLWKLTIDASNANLNRGLLDFEQIESLTKYLEDKWNNLHKNALKLEDQIAELKENLELLTRKRAELDANRSRTEREAVLYLSRDGDRKSAVQLSYLVNKAGWQQQYNLRANPGKSNVLIEYNAVVHQNSGEDWNGIKVSLSTAEPTMVAAPPVLEPMLVGLERHAQTQQSAQQQSIAGMAGGFKSQLKQRRASSKKGISASRELNILAVDNQAFIFNAGKREIQLLQQQMEDIARIEGVSVTYNLPGKLTLPSRDDQQMVSIATIKADADFTLIATPLLTDYVYLQADLLNSSDTVLLPGQASMVRNGEFVGKGHLPLVTIGENFTSGFGIDSQIQVSRELTDKKTRVQGGNRIDAYDYTLTLANYKNIPVKLRLLDRLPYTDNSSIKIDLAETDITPLLSKNAEYLSSARKKGVLRWDLQLEPNTIGKKESVVRYSFTMEYDKNTQIQPRRPSK